MNLKKFVSENIINIGSSDEDTPKHQPPPPPPAHKEAPTPKSFINRQEDQVNSPGNAVVNAQNNGVISTDALSEARSRIAKVIADNNLQGTDYYEFIITKNAMSSIPVENERYKVAFAGLSAMGLTKDILNTSAKFYIKTVDNELNSFLDQFAKVFKTEVLDKKDTITAKQKQMVQLSEQINKLNEEIKKMNDDVQHDEATFVMKKNSFMQAASEAQTTIQSELDKINEYIS